MNTLYAQTITKDYVEGRVDQLKGQFQERFDLVDEKIDNLKEAIEFSYNSLRGGLKDLSEEMDARFQVVDEKLKNVEGELKIVHGKIDALDQKLTPLLGLLTLIQK